MIFHPLTPPTLLSGYKFSLFLVVFKVKPKLSSILQNPIGVVPTPTMMVPWIKSPSLFFNVLWITFLIRTQVRLMTHTTPVWHHLNYSWTLNNTASNCMGPLTLPQYYMICSWLNPQMRNWGYERQNEKLYADFQLKVSAPTPPHPTSFVQGSTVITTAMTTSYLRCWGVGLHHVFWRIQFSL